jgi:hypothetical protein
MTGSADNRAARRRGKLRRAKAVAGATATAVAVGLAAAPGAQAITVDRDFTWDPVYSSGLVAGLLDFVSKVMPGVDAQLSDTISFQTGPPPSLGLEVATSLVQSGAAIYANIGLNLNFRTIAGNTANLYNTVAGLPQPGCGPGGGGDTGSSSYATNCRFAVQLATLGTQFNLLDAYRAQIQSVQGQTPAGLISYQPSPNATSALPSQTNQALIILQNPDRPNGGIAARFPGISKALGIDSTMPAAGKVTSPDGKTALNTATLDLTWAYDPIGDFPAVFNIWAMANSWLAALPLNIVTGGLAAEPLQGSSLGDIGLNLASVLQLPLDIVAAGFVNIYSLKMVPGEAFYSTLVPNELPITTAIGLPGTLVNFALNAVKSPFLLGNPLADILAPSMRIKVNSAYTDVLTPDGVNTCATGCGTADAKTWAELGYQAYDRTFGAYSAPGGVASAATPTRFGSVDPLTPEEKKEARRDSWEAFAGALKDQLQKPFWGIIVPSNPSAATPSAAVKPAATVKATEEAPAAAEVSPVAPEAVSVPEAPEPVAPVAAPAKAPAVADIPELAKSAAVEDAPATTSRGARRAGEDRPTGPTQRRAASADSDGPAKAAASTGKRHRAAG